jgi:hypothetical protein
VRKQLRVLLSFPGVYPGPVLVDRRFSNANSNAEAVFSPVFPGGPFLWTDVDVQVVGPCSGLRALVDAALAEHPDADLFCQREFEDAGCNVGVLVVRPSPRLVAFLAAWRAEVKATGRLDQKILNATLVRNTRFFFELF